MLATWLDYQSADSTLANKDTLHAAQLGLIGQPRRVQPKRFQYQVYRGANELHVGHCNSPGLQINPLAQLAATCEQSKSGKCQVDCNNQLTTSRADLKCISQMAAKALCSRTNRTTTIRKLGRCRWNLRRLNSSRVCINLYGAQLFSASRCEETSDRSQRSLLGTQTKLWAT